MILWELLQDFVAFIRYRKKYWMAPLLLILMLVGALIVVVPNSPLAAFVYTLF